MAAVRETQLPGVGVRHDFTTEDGTQIAVLVHRDGRRDLLVYDREDPDSCTGMLFLDPDDARTLAELMGASTVTETVLAVQQQIEPGRLEGKRCVGVSLAFARGTNPGLSLQPADPSIPLAASPGPLYPGESDREHAVVPLRWERLAEGTQLRVAALPLVVAALIE